MNTAVPIVRRPPPTLIVSGLGRCGTSLAMQMLAAAGLPTLGRFPDFEDETHRIGVVAAAQIEAWAGGAMKLIIGMQDIPPIPPARIAVVFMLRDHAEQAKSQHKFIAANAGVHLSRPERRHWASKMGPWERAALAAFMPRAPVLQLRYERLLAGDPAPITALLDFLAGLNFPVVREVAFGAMRRQIIARSPRCAPDLAIEEALIERGALA